MRGILSRWAAQVALFYFSLITFWWIYLYWRFGLQSNFLHLEFAASYGLICFLGAFRGFFHARTWGGLGSVLGRSLIFLCLGLLFQEFGQLVFSYYNIFLKVDVPYPSLADVGFFGSIPFYAIGIILLAKASGVAFSLGKLLSRLQLVALPTAMLFLAYAFFLRGYQFDASQPLKIFLDFGYPFGQAIYISLTIETYSLSRKFLGGLMRPKILLLLLAFVGQFAADYNFLFQSSRGTWLNGGYGDYLYFVAYFLMTLGLIAFYDPEIIKLVPVAPQTPTADVYSQIILKIMAEQKQIIGPVALEEAARVGAIKVSADLSKVEVVGDARAALESLVAQYQKLFGRTAVEVSKHAAADLLAQLPASEIPEILK